MVEGCRFASPATVVVVGIGIGSNTVTSGSSRRSGGMSMFGFLVIVIVLVVISGNRERGGGSTEVKEGIGEWMFVGSGDSLCWKGLDIIIIIQVSLLMERIDYSFYA